MSPPWLESRFAAAAPAQIGARRGVEAQHIIAMLRLVDTLEEQAGLERLLSASKPALPAPKSRFGAGAS